MCSQADDPSQHDIVPDRKHCNTVGCKRKPERGWAFCPECLKRWLDGQHR